MSLARMTTGLSMMLFGILAGVAGYVVGYFFEGSFGYWIMVAAWIVAVCGWFLHRRAVNEARGN